MPLTDADLLNLIARTADALDQEAAWLVDVDVDDHGRQRADIPARDRDYFDTVTEQAQALRELVVLIRERQRA